MGSLRSDLTEAISHVAPRGRVVVNGSPLWPPVTGVQRVARGLVQRLLVETEPEQIVVRGAPVEFGGNGRGIIGRRIPRLVWEQTALPFVARNASTIFNLGNLAPIGSRRNLVLTYDLHALRYPGHYRAARGWTYWRIVVAAYRRARYRVTLTRTVADDLEATLGGHVDAVLPPGIDDTFRPASQDRVQDLRERLHLDGPYLTVIGWAQPGKRATLAVAAHRQLVRSAPHQLVLTGAARADFTPVQFGTLPRSVVKSGHLSDPDLAALHTGSAGLLFCTEYEGFGLPSVEALACGAPVAASRIPVTEEVLSGLPGVAFVNRSTVEDWADAGAALIDAASRPDAAAARERLSRAVLDRYRWEGKGRALMELVR